jgi:general stress protein 26
MKRPLYNHEGESKALYCSTHKQSGMLDVKNKRCIYEGCMKQSLYNHEGESKALYCSTHKQSGMLDVKSKRCIYEGCMKQPLYNHEGESKALYCSTHKQSGMLDVKNKRCKINMCYIVVKKKYEGYCLRCFVHTFPDRKVSRNYKTKEQAVVDHVKSKFPNVDWITDKIVKDGCSRRRPDLLVDLGYQIVIVEIDENQHETYESCENKRIMELSQDLGHRPIVFIRFNPDDYRVHSKVITSCWGVNKMGLCVVKKCKQKEWESRLAVLDSHLEEYFCPSNRITKTVSQVHLFYDEI